jgi:putative transposase
MERHAMSHTYVCCYMHCIFSTKERKEIILPNLQTRLWPYIGGIARDNGMVAEEVGGTKNHCHLLLSLPSTMAIAKAMQLLKGGSSKWIGDTFPDGRLFGWQEGYGGFSVSRSMLDATRAYIRNQEEHHRHRTFEEEFIAFLKRYGVEYDPQHVFD